MNDTTISTIPSYPTDLKMNYANYATLQVLEKELDRLKEERQARRLSMFADIQPRMSSSTPPPQFKRRHSTSPEVIVSIENTKNEQKEEFIGNSDSSVYSSSSSTTSSNSDIDSIIMEDEPQLQPNQYILNDSNNVQQHEHEKHITKENSYQSSTVPNLTTITATTTTTTTSIPTPIFEKKHNDEKTQEPVLSSTKVTTKKNDKTSIVSTLMQNYSKRLESSHSTPTKQIATNNKNIKELTNSFLKKDGEKEIDTKKSKPFHREKKPHLRIQTMFDQQQKQQQPIPEQKQLHKPLLYNKQKNDHENKLLLHAKQNLKKSITTVSSPSLSSSIVPSSSKSASSILYKPKNDEKENKNDIPIKGKRIQASQSTNISTTATNHKMLLRENKPRPLSDAFIGVKGLSKKFDPTHNEQSTSSPRIRRDSKPLLSPASQSVSRDRKISSSKRPASVNALSQLFSSSPSTEKTFNQSTKKSLSKPRQSKPLPPIHFVQQQKEVQQQEPKQQHQNKEKKKMIMTKKNMSLPSRNNSMKIESHRLYHKTMPSIPNNNSNTRPPIGEFPNPLPVYTPLLTHLATEEKEQEEKQEKQIQKQSPTPALEQEIKVPSSIKASGSTPEEPIKKRVSFSSVITSIPPPSPFSDDEEAENSNNSNNRRSSSTMSSAHLLSLWQQEHEKERQRRDRTNPPVRKIATASITTNNNSQKNDTSTFWEAFSTEMNNRAAPDLRKVEPKSQLKKQQQPRFIPSTFSNKGEVREFLPSPIKSSSTSTTTQETISSPQKTWINMLQDKLVKKNSMEKLDQPPPKALTSNNNNNIRSLWNDNNKLTSLSRKPVVSFDQPTKTAPLYHPTKTRPKKPSSFRKSQNMHHHYPLRNNIVGPEVSIPPTAVQKSWHRNY
ncbi:hypothetical protein BDC45DRAFT_531364 [Circinella umbellata]|nr:hypothetical protein BDC45DRAFT_531364 [Circinella umbellata]